MGLLEQLFGEGGLFYEPTPLELKRDVVSQSTALAKLRMDAACAVKKLAEENDRLRLYCAALARLLVKKGVVSLAEISDMIDVIDPEDGFRDGKLSGRLMPGEKPAPAPIPKVRKPVGKVPRPPKRALAKPPAGWKPKLDAKKNP